MLLLYWIQNLAQYNWGWLGFITPVLDLFLDILDFAPQGVIDLIKKLAVELPLGDTYKLEALYKATGFDANAAIRNMRESNEGLVNKEEVAKTRRVSAPEVPKAAEPVKYKIIEK